MSRMDNANVGQVPISVYVHSFGGTSRRPHRCAFAVSYPSRIPTYFVVEETLPAGRSRLRETRGPSPLHSGTPNARFVGRHTDRLAPGV